MPGVSAVRPNNKNTSADGPTLGDVMKISTGVLAGVAVLAMAQAAEAAPPKVSGKYALMSFTQCQAQFTTTSDAEGVQSINPTQNGEINIAVGTMTFPNTPASSGSASLEMSIVSGPALRINGSGGNILTHTENISGTFAVTGNQPNSTFRLTPTGEPAMTWTLRAGNIVSGVARTLYMTRRETARCISGVTATKQ